MKTSRCKLLITAFIVSALLIAGLSIGLAENTRPEFEGVWSDAGIHMVIEREGDLYHVSIDWGDGEFAVESELECRYDEANKCLTGNGTRTDEETGEITEEKDVTLVIDVIDDEGIITISSPEWTGGPVEALYNGKYEGVWQNGNQLIRIDVYGGYIYCTVEEQGSSPRNEWCYSEGLYDPETGNVVSENGSKFAVTGVGSDGERTCIEDTGEAVFSITEDDCLIWNDLKENAGEGRRYERMALYRSPLGFTIRYPEKRLEAVSEPTGEDDGETIRFAAKDPDSGAKMVCYALKGAAHPFWEGEGYRNLKADDSFTEEIGLSMDKSLYLWQKEDGTESVEALWLNWCQESADYVVFAMFLPAGDPDGWQETFESMLKTLDIPPVGEDRYGFRLDFLRDDEEGQQYVAEIILENDDLPPYVLLCRKEARDFVLEKVEWDTDTLTVRNAETLYSAEVLSPGEGVKIYSGLFPDPLPALRICYTDPMMDDNRCIYLTESGIDLCLHLIDEESVLREYWYHYTADNGRKYESFVVNKLHYDTDHQVTAVTGKFVHLYDDGESLEEERAENGKLFTYSLAKNFHADMNYSQYASPISTVQVTNLHQWYIDTYMDGEKPEGDELTFGIDLTEDGDRDADFWDITTWIALNENNEIYYMRQRPVPWE